MLCTTWGFLRDLKCITATLLITTLELSVILCRHMQTALELKLNVTIGHLYGGLFDKFTSESRIIDSVYFLLL